MSIKWLEQVGKEINGYKIVDVKREDKRTLAYVKCKYCQNLFWTRAENINNNVSCGCRANETRFKVENITGKTFHFLKTIEPTNERDKNSGAVIWKCKCLKCGNYKNISATVLKSGKTYSCGCVRKEYEKASGQKLGKIIKSGCIDGTNVRNLRSNIRNDNTSGIKGVFWNKEKNKWQASITFKSKHYYLGRYENLEDAASIRKEAEEQIFGEFLKWYNKNYKIK